MAKERIVCVEWMDACYNSGYYDEKTPEEFSPVTTRTVGHLIKSNREGILLSFERFYSNGKRDSDRRIDTIPRKMIKKVTYLKEV